MALISKKKFLEKDDYKHKDVFIKQLDGEIRIRALSIREQMAFEDLAASNDNNQSELMFELILKCCIDEEGQLLFDEKDLEALKDKSADIIITLFKAILDINNIDQGEVDQLAKN